MKRSSNTIYLGYGLLIGMALTVLVIVVISNFQSNNIARAMMGTESTQTPAPLSPSPALPAIITYTSPPIVILPPTSTFTPTPTLIVLNPTASDTPVPTSALTAGEQKFLSGELAITGPLTKDQQIQLYNTSIRFIALTTRESINVGEQFAGVGYGSPTLICGPLSIHILQDSGLLSNEGLIPLDFWLLNPFLPKDRALTNRTFPPAQYERHDITTSIRGITFSTFPLYPGDFLYIKHGSGGTFDHMLVVTRVDNMGRAYSVTNYNADQGFIIDEVMLYDPNDPTAGIFQTWTQQRKALKGATGFGGFELWRLRTP